MIGLEGENEEFIRDKRRSSLLENKGDHTLLNEYVVIRKKV